VGLFGLLAKERVIATKSNQFCKEVNEAIIDYTKAQEWTLKFEEKEIYTYECGKGSEEVVFIGDSALFQYAPRIEKIIRDNKINIHAVLIWSPATLAIRNCSNSANRTDLLMEKLYWELKNRNVKKVVIAAMWNVYFDSKSEWCYKGEKLSKNIYTKDKVFSELGTMTKELVDAGKQVFIVSLVPYGDLCDPKQFYKRTFLGPYYNAKRLFSEKDFWKASNNLYIEESLNNVIPKAGGHVIHPSESLIKYGFCLIQDNNEIIRFDHHHLRAKYVREHIKYLDNTLAP
jgi:hypothetical protein